MPKRSSREKNFPFDIVSVLLGAVSFFSIGLLYPPIATLPLGLTAGFLAVKKNSSRIGLVLNILALIAYGAYWIFWYNVGQSFKY